MEIRFSRWGLLAAVLAAAGYLGGCGGGSSGNAGSSLSQTPAGNFSLSAPAVIAVTPSSSQTISVSLAPANGFSSAVSVTLAALPAGVTAAPASFTLIPGSSPQAVVIAANASAAPGPVDLVVTGTSGSLSDTVTTSTSQAAFAFAGPSQATALAAGGTAAIDVSASGFNGFSGPVSAVLTGLPAGVTASPSTFTLTPGGAQTITLSAAADAQAGPSTLTLQGTAGTLLDSFDLPLVLSAVPSGPAEPDFSLSLTPSAMTLAAGGSPGQATLSATAIDGFSGTVSVALSGLPSGVVAMPANFMLTPGKPQQISLTVAATDTAAAAALVFSAFSGSDAHTAELALTITPPAPNFSLEASPAALTLTAGGSAQPVSVTATSLYGFSGPINVVVSGLPAAVTASPAALTLTPGVAQTLNLTAGSNAAAGTGALNLLGDSGTISNSASVGLTIDTSTPDFVFSATPPVITVTPGTFQPVMLSIVPLSGFNSGVTVTTGSLPNGVVVSPSTGLVGSGFFPSPATIPPLAPNVPELLYVGVPAGDSAPATIDFEASAGSLIHDATVTANPGNSSGASSDLYLTSWPRGLLLYPGEPVPAGSAELAVTAASFEINANSPTPTITLTSPLPPGITSTVTDIGPNGVGLPSPGVDVNFAVATSAVGTSGTLAFQASSGSATGSMTREIDVPYSVVAGPELTQLLIPSTTLTLAQGSTEDLYLALASTGQGSSADSFADPTIAITGLPFGVTSMETTGLVPSAISEPFTAAATTAVGETPVTVTSTWNGTTQTSQFTLNVVSIPNFTLAATPNTFDMAEGATQTFALEAEAINGFAGDVNVNLSNAGSLTVTPSTLTLTPGTPQQISVTAPPTGNNSGEIMVQAAAGALSQNLTVLVNVLPPGPDFSVEPPSSIALGDYTVGTFPVISSSLVGSVTEVLTGLPPGLSLASGIDVNDLYLYTQPPLTLPATCGVASQGPAYPGTNCSYYVYALEYQGAAAGTYPLTLTATYTPNPNASQIPGSPSYPITHTYQFPLLVTPPDYSLSVFPANLTIAPGTSQSFTVTATPLASGTGSISFGLLSSLPSGVTATSTSSRVNGGQYTATFTLSAAADASPGPVTLAVQAVSQIPVVIDSPGFGFTHTIQLPLVVSP